MKGRSALNDKEEYLRWLETMWEHYNNISREEKRKEKVLKIFRDISEMAKREVESPDFPPW